MVALIWNFIYFISGCANILLQVVLENLRGKVREDEKKY